MESLLARGACAAGHGEEVHASVGRVQLDACMVGEVAGVDVADPRERGGEVAAAVGWAVVVKAERGVSGGAGDFRVRAAWVTEVPSATACRCAKLLVATSFTRGGAATRRTNGRSR